MQQRLTADNFQRLGFVRFGQKRKIMQNNIRIGKFWNHRGRCVIAISTSAIAVIDDVYFTTVWRGNLAVNDTKAAPVIRSLSNSGS
jgi:hypothetical protein